MADSMTGYGTSEIQSSEWRCTVELRSANQRFLDILEIPRVPAGMSQSRRDGRGPSLRSCLKGYTRMSKMTVKLMVSLHFVDLWVPLEPGS